MLLRAILLLRIISGLRSMKVYTSVILITLMSAFLTYPALAAGINYLEYNVNDLRVIVINARNPSYIFEYCGDNYIDLNSSNDYAVIGPDGIPGAGKYIIADNINIIELAKNLDGL